MLKAICSSCFPIRKRMVSVSWTIWPDSSLRPSITSTEMGEHFLLVGILYLFTNCRSMKQDEAPESISVEEIEIHDFSSHSLDCRVKIGAVGGEKLSLLREKFWSNESPPTNAGPIIFPAEQASTDSP